MIDDTHMIEELKDRLADAIARAEKAERIISDADTELIKSSVGRDYRFSLAQQIKFLNEGVKSNFERWEACNKLWNDERKAKGKAEREHVETAGALGCTVKEREELRSERDALQARVRELEELLREMTDWWFPWDSEREQCPICKGRREHTTDCLTTRVNAALGGGKS